MKCFALESFNLTCQAEHTKINSRLNFNPGLALITFWTTRPWIVNLSSNHGDGEKHFLIKNIILTLHLSWNFRRCVLRNLACQWVKQNGWTSSTERETFSASWSPVLWLNCSWSAIRVSTWNWSPSSRTQSLPSWSPSTRRFNGCPSTWRSSASCKAWPLTCFTSSPWRLSASPATQPFVAFSSPYVLSPGPSDHRLQVRCSHELLFFLSIIRFRRSLFCEQEFWVFQIFGFREEKSCF